MQSAPEAASSLWRIRGGNRLGGSFLEQTNWHVALLTASMLFAALSVVLIFPVIFAFALSMRIRETSLNGTAMRQDNFLEQINPPAVAASKCRTEPAQGSNLPKDPRSDCEPSTDSPASRRLGGFRSFLLLLLLCARLDCFGFRYAHMQARECSFCRDQQPHDEIVYSDKMSRAHNLPRGCLGQSKKRLGMSKCCGYVGHTL